MVLLWHQALPMAERIPAERLMSYKSAKEALSWDRSTLRLPKFISWEFVFPINESEEMLNKYIPVQDVPYEIIQSTLKYFDFNKYDFIYTYWRIPDYVKSREQYGEWEGYLVMDGKTRAQLLVHIVTTAWKREGEKDL